LLYGGAINTAGQVAARKRARAATSDWMELEKERGISITSTVLQFPYHGMTLNLLDTPGHQDFGEDTYRTLLAADSAVMLIDAAKGVEPQTRKLFAICRARRIPLFTFINKLDRPSQDPLALLDELENVLGIGAFPINWPIGSGPDFRGVYDRTTREVHLFERTQHGAKMAPVSVTDVRDPRIAALTDEGTYSTFLDQIDLLEGAGAAFDRDAMLRGDATPVFFGSAVTNFGVQLFLDGFVKMAPTPTPRMAHHGNGTIHAVPDLDRTPVDPNTDHFSGFVFKIQANMDPRHRDRIAFVRVCSGKFERDMTVRNMRTGKEVRLTRAMKLFASERESVDLAFAGDVVGLANPGSFAIGDTLVEGDSLAFDPIPAFEPEHFSLVRALDTAQYKSFQKGIAQLREEGAIQVMYPYNSLAFDPIPAFEPEHFSLVRALDTAQYKSFQKGIAQLREEGAIQVMYPYNDTQRSEPIFAAVGELQFEVVKYRLEAEYNVKTQFTRLNFGLARHVRGDLERLPTAQLPSNAKLVEDWESKPLALFESEWSVRLAEEWNPTLRFEPFGTKELMTEALSS